LTNEEIRELIQMVVDSGIAEMEVQRGDDRVCIRRVVASRNDVPHVPEPARTVEAAAPAVASAHGSVPAHNSAAPAEAQDAVLVKSPIVGTFYDAPSPGAPPFVRVGDQVEPGQVLCIIESMKLMNEIEAEMAGTVVSKLMETGRPVEYGEALFAVRPR
jgi:acetyl-CoA carboxylase biotin carboxyl carrier protein